MPPYVLDLACPALRITIEADGRQRNESGEHNVRDERLARRGWLVLRFWTNEISSNTNGIISVIQTAYQQRAERAPPALN